MDATILETKLQNIIERKYEELNLGRDYNAKFSKIRDFEANAIGQIGEEFVKNIILLLDTGIEIIDPDKIIHAKYDIKVKTNSGEILLEIKTARKGKWNDKFQFNGIRSHTEYHYLICLGLCENNVKFRIFPREDMYSKNRKIYVKDGNFEKKIYPSMDRLTLNLKELFDISYLLERLNIILK